MKTEALDKMRVEFEVTIRPCTEEDLPKLEWFGQFTEHREIFYQTFERHRKGTALMLVAEANRFPAGQVWINFKKSRESSIGVIWALRVLGPFQGHGIGTRLINAAERELRERGVEEAEIGVETHNHRAAQLYERLGYRIADRSLDEYSFTTPDGTRMTVPVDQWLLRKNLNGRQRGTRHERKKK